MFKSIILSLILFSISPWLQASSFSHTHWNDLLKKHVTNTADGHSTQINYAAFKKQRSDLNAYLKTLSALSQAQFDVMAKDEQLAFLINAYNAWTVELILTKYPDLTSIKDLGSIFSSPWKKSFIPLLGETISLDDIEHGLIRGSDRYQDPRIHFAVNCASIGCPALRTEAYTGDKLDTQLEDQTRRFLSDRSRNRFSKDTMELSSIFKWYRDDFEAGWRKAESLSAFLALYSNALSLSPETEKQLRSGSIDIDFLDYDWNLNSAQ